MSACPGSMPHTQATPLQATHGLSRHSGLRRPAAIPMHLFLLPCRHVSKGARLHQGPARLECLHLLHHVCARSAQVRRYELEQNWSYSCAIGRLKGFVHPGLLTASTCTCGLCRICVSNVLLMSCRTRRHLKSL